MKKSVFLIVIVSLMLACFASFGQGLMDVSNLVVTSSPEVSKWLSIILTILFVFEQVIVKMNWTPTWAKSNSTTQLIWNVILNLLSKIN